MPQSWWNKDVTEEEQKTLDFMSSAIGDYAGKKYEQDKQYTLNRYNLVGHINYNFVGRTNRISRIKDAPHRKTCVFPLILPKYVTLISNIVNSSKKLEIQPANTNSDNLRKAMVSEAVARQIMRENNFEKRFLPAAVGESATTAACFAAPVWNAKAGKKKEYFKVEVTEETDEEGNTIEKGDKTKIGEANIGKVEYIKYLTSELTFPPRARSWEEVIKNYYIVNKHKLALDVMMEFNLPKMPDGDNRLHASTMDEKIMGVSNSNYKDNSNGAPQQTAQKYVDIFELWQYPNKEYPQGRHAVLCCGRIIYDDTLPDWCQNEEDEYELPLCFLPWYEIPGRFMPMSFVQPQIDWQKTTNEIINNTLENQRLSAGGKLLIEFGSLVNCPRVTNEPFQKLFVKKSAKNRPAFIQPQNNVAANINMQKSIQELGEDISNTRGISAGRTPSGVTSGRAIESLAELDQSDLGIINNNIEFFVTDLVRKSLNIARRKYKEPRVATIYGKDKYEQVQVKDGSEIGTSLEIVYQFGRGLPNNKYARTNFVIGMVDAEILTAEEGQKKIGEFNIMELKNEDLLLDEAQVRRHLEYLEAGEYEKATPTPFENHALHFRLETNEMKKERFDAMRLTDPLKYQAYYKHVMTHQAMLMGSVNSPGLSLMQNSDTDREQLTQQAEGAPAGQPKINDGGQAKEKSMIRR